MYIPKCHCCGGATIRAFNAETGEEIWSASHGAHFTDEAIEEFDCSLFVHDGENNVEIEAFGNAVDGQQAGQIVRYIDQGGAADVAEYSQEELWNTEIRWRNRTRMIREREGYWHSFAFRGRNPEGGNVFGLAAVGIWGSDLLQVGQVQIHNAGAITFNGAVDTIDVVIPDQTRDRFVTLHVRPGFDIVRIDESLSEVAKFSELNSSDDWVVENAGPIGNGKWLITKIELEIVGDDSPLEPVEAEPFRYLLCRTDSNLVVSDEVEIPQGMNHMLDYEILNEFVPDKFPLHQQNSNPIGETSNRDHPEDFDIFPISDQGSAIILVGSGGITNPENSVLHNGGLILVQVEPLAAISGAYLEGQCLYAESHDQKLYLSIRTESQLLFQKWGENGLEWSAELGSRQITPGIPAIVFGSTLLAEGDIIVVGQLEFENDQYGIARISGSNGDVLWRSAQVDDEHYTITRRSNNLFHGPPRAPRPASEGMYLQRAPLYSVATGTSEKVLYAVGLKSFLDGGPY